MTSPIVVLAQHSALIDMINGHIEEGYVDIDGLPRFEWATERVACRVRLAKLFNCLRNPHS